MAQRTPSRRPRSSGASRRSGGKRSSGGAPVWVWLVTGLFTGLFIAFLLFLSRVDTAPGKGEPQQAKAPAHADKAAKAKPPESSPPKGEAATASRQAEPELGSGKEPVKTAAASKPPSAKPPSAKPAEPAPEKPALNYDFYKILPKSEVIVPEEELRKPASSSVASPPGTYYLQVGAFRRLEEADSRKAELAMLGIVSSIQTVTTDPGNSWHRVRIGPVKDLRGLERAKRQLQENSISFVTLRESR